MQSKRRVVGQQIGFLLGQASQAPPSPAAPNPMMTQRIPFMNPGTPPVQGGPSPLFRGFGGFGGGRLPFGGTGTGAVPPVPAPGGTGGLGGILQGLFGGSGSLDIPSILSNAQKMIGAVNQAGEVFKNIGPMLQLLKGLNLAELLKDTDEEVLSEEDAHPKKKKKKRKKRKTPKRKKKLIKNKKKRIPTKKNKRKLIKK